MNYYVVGCGIALLLCIALAIFELIDIYGEIE